MITIRAGICFIALCLAMIVLFTRDRVLSESRRNQTIDDVYSNLQDDYDFEQINSRSRFVVRTVNANEKKYLDGTILNIDRAEVTCCPFAKTICDMQKRIVIDKELVWYRVSDPRVSGKWIGIAVREHYFTGWSPKWVWYRIRVDENE